MIPISRIASLEKAVNGTVDLSKHNCEVLKVIAKPEGCTERMSASTGRSEVCIQPSFFAPNRVAAFREKDIPLAKQHSGREPRGTAVSAG